MVIFRMLGLELHEEVSEWEVVTGNRLSGD